MFPFTIFGCSKRSDINADATWTWAKNEAFLSGIVKRGDVVVFAGKYNPSLLDPLSVLAKEIQYLRANGYVWTSDYTRMIHSN